MNAKDATKLIAKGLESRESDEAKALGYLQKLNLAGMDVKGQISSAYGQSGYGLGIDAKFDFGALLVPFVHLDAGFSMAGSRTAHALLVLQRMPKAVWVEDHPRPPQPPAAQALALPPTAPVAPTWKTQQPIAMAFLKGRTLKLDAKVSTAAWAGFGSFEDFDETGLTIGIKAEVSAGGSITRLVETQPRHYRSLRDGRSTLADDVDDLFEVRLKAKVMAWILACVEGVNKLQSYDIPAISLREQARDAGLSDDAETALLTTLDYYDRLAVNDVDSIAIAGLGLQVKNVLVSAVKRVKGMLTTASTDDLLKELGTIKAQLDELQERFKHKEGNELLPSDVRKELWDATVRRLHEVKELIAALKRRKERKARLSAPQVAPAAAKRAPPFHLDISAVEGSLDGAAGAKLVLPRETVTAKLALEGRCQFRRISFRYQATAPGKDDRTLLSSQDTVIRYTTRKATLTGAASALETKATGFLKERGNLVTMSYRSVHVQWFDDLKPNNGQALPNGSGVSFGLSVLAESLDLYRRACIARGKPAAGAPSPPPIGDFSELETAMTKQLRVTAEELRSFMRDLPDWIGESYLDDEDKTRVESFLVESSFAFTAPQKLVIVDRRPDALFALPPVIALLKATQRPAELRLQALRLRYRVRTDDDKSRSLINLGWNPEPWGEGLKPWGQGSVDGSQPWYVRLTGVDPKLPNWFNLPALALQLGIGLERVQRVGSEGIVELHHSLFPQPYDPSDAPQGYGRPLADTLTARNWRLITDLLVPPVTLFSQ